MSYSQFACSAVHTAMSFDKVWWASLCSSIHQITVTYWKCKKKGIVLKFTFWSVLIFVLSSCLTYVTVLLGIALAHCSYFEIAATHLTWRYNSQCHWVLSVLTSTGSRAKILFSFPLLHSCRCWSWIMLQTSHGKKGLLLSITALYLSKITQIQRISHNNSRFVSANQTKSDPLMVVSATIPTTAKTQEVFLEGSNCHFIFSLQHLWQNIYLTVAQALLQAGV